MHWLDDYIKFCWDLLHDTTISKLLALCPHFFKVLCKPLWPRYATASDRHMKIPIFLCDNYKANTIYCLFVKLIFLLEFVTDTTLISHLGLPNMFTVLNIIAVLNNYGLNFKFFSSCLISDFFFRTRLKYILFLYFEIHLQKENKLEEYFSYQ